MAALSPGRMFSEPEDILVICTGGTFDKKYDPILESLIVDSPACKNILENVKGGGVIIRSIVAKDSLDLTTEDIENIRNAILDSSEQKIVVIHGTSRIVDTAKAVPREVGKSVVFTGAMIPASIYVGEAAFNLGFALAAARIIDKGVWIAMGGQLYDPEHVVKDSSKGVFRRI